MSPRRFKSMLVVVLALGAFAALVATAPAAMRSDKINKNLCETTGGGKFVPIPGFPGEKADRRLLTDIKYLRRKYDIFITDGLSKDARPRRQRRASDRPRPRHRPERRQGRYLEGDLEACQAGRTAAERSDRAVPLGRLQRRRRPRPRQPPPPLLEPLRHPSGASGEDGLHAALPGLRFDRRRGGEHRRRKHRRRQGRRQGRGWQRRRGWRHPRRRRQGRRRWRRWHLPAAPDGSVRGPRRRSGHRDRRRRPPVAQATRPAGLRRPSRAGGSRGTDCRRRRPARGRPG